MAFSPITGRVTFILCPTMTTIIQTSSEQLKTPALPGGSLLLKETPFSSRLRPIDPALLDPTLNPFTRTPVLQTSLFRVSLPARELLTSMFLRVTGSKLYLPIHQLKFDYDLGQITVGFTDSPLSLTFGLDQLVIVQFPIRA